MGINLDTFKPASRGEFRARLDSSLDVLRTLLSSPGFGYPDATVGAELEMFLVDSASFLPAPVCENVRASMADPRVTSEVSRYNAEVNLSPVPLRGRPFTALHAETTQLMDAIGASAVALGARPLLNGTLPTLRREHLTREYLSPVPRYTALDRALARQRGHRFQIVVDGKEGRCTFAGDSVGVLGATASWQVHLSVAASAYSRFYNAAQLATGPALAVAVNSPRLLHTHLWEETRIPWYEQGVDATGSGLTGSPRVLFGRNWLRLGALELFEEAVHLYEPLLTVLSEEDPREALSEGRVPLLEELRFQQSTVWTWNRPVYDPSPRGHLRIELRALPSGPTPADMTANAAFLLGLILHLADAPQADLVTSIPFEYARTNFYRVARDGLACRLWWPSEDGGPARRWRADDLVGHLLPRAASGLHSAGVEPGEYERWLSVITERVRGGRTGARWQHAAIAATETAARQEEHMTDRYARLSATDAPVHTWPTADRARTGG